MNDDLSPASPLGQSNIPIQDIPSQYIHVPSGQGNAVSAELKTDNSSRKLRMLILIVGSTVFGIFILLLLVLGILTKQRSSQQQFTPVGPTATGVPLVTPSDSVLPQELLNRVSNLEKSTNENENTVLELNFPQLDWKIRY